LRICNCAQLDDIVSCGDKEVDEFIRPKGLRLLREGRYVGLYLCRECGTYWQVDLGARGPQAIKVAEPLGWEHFDDVPFRLKFMERVHGGVGEERCMFRGCTEFALKGIVFCVRDAYPSVAEPGRPPGSLGK
jgi:hypothetical protein